MVSKPKLPPQEITPVPYAPTKSDASIVSSGQRELQRYASYVGGAGNFSSQLSRKAKTQKSSLIGGG